MLTPELKSRGIDIGPAIESSFQTPRSKCPVTSTFAIKFPLQVYNVVEVEITDGDFAPTLWMPESSMVSCSFSTSQLVAVFVCETVLFEHPEASHVENLEERCSREFGFLSNDCLVEEAGSYCVIATVWPCRKLKDGVRLSKQLAYALGCPQPGKQISTTAITCSVLEYCRSLKPNKATAMDANIHDCQELVLRWCPIDVKDEHADTFQSPILVKAISEQRRIVPKSNKKTSSSKGDELEHEEVTPEQQRLVQKSNKKTSSVRESKREAGNQSHSKSKHGGCGESKLSQKIELAQNMWQKKDEAALSEMLADENSRASKLLQRFAGRLLHGRYLMKGNIVGILVCGRYCLFKVIDAKHPSKNQENVCDKAKQNSGFPWTEVPNILHIGSNTHIVFIIPSTEAVNHVHLNDNEDQVKESIQSSQHIVVPIKQLEYSQLGGLSDQISTLKEIIKFSLLQPDRLISLGLQPPHGVLLHGPPGTGKTSLALAAAKEAGVKFFPINGPEIITEYYGESEAALQSVFTAAQAEAPSVVFIDELDAIAPQRSDGSEDLGRRLVATLLTIMDGSEKYLHHVLVVAATNRPEAVDSALRRPGRFDREIEIGVPTPSGRLEILISLLSRMRHALTNTDIETLASATHGFVGADLSSLCNEAALVALRRNVQGIVKNETKFEKLISDCINENSVSAEVSDVTLDFGNLNISTELGWSGDPLRITMVDFEEAKTKVRPSGMREVILEVPKVNWSDIGGQEEAKQQLREAVEWPQKHADAFSRIGTQPPKGVLLYGPPGCSKTLMARAVATEAGLNFIAVKGPELFSKWVGESEKAVHSLFQRAQVASPSIVFFDELDGLAVSRDSGHDGASVGNRVMSQLLVEMDGLSSRNGVTVIAATNRPDKIDPALLRPGRFDKLLYVGPPDEAARLQIFKIHTKNMPCALDVDRRELAMQTKGYTGADIAGVCREAAIAALEEDLNTKEVSMRHFNSALKTVGCSVSEVSESMYRQFSRSSI